MKSISSQFAYIAQYCGDAKIVNRPTLVNEFRILYQQALVLERKYANTIEGRLERLESQTHEHEGLD
jgi:hypothetical protein